MNKKTKWLWGSFSLIIIISFLIFFFFDNKEIIKVQTDLVQRNQVIQIVNASGKIQPEIEVKISAISSAIIDTITVDEGDYVIKNQHLISLDTKQLKANVNQANSAVQSAIAKLNLDKANKLRTEQLFKENLVSSQELEAIEANYQISLSQLNQAEANLIIVQDILDKARLVSPQNGIVTKINKEIGEMAMGSMFSLDVLMIIADLNKMEVIVDVNENDVISISIGDTTDIEIDAFIDTTFKGIVSEIAHMAETSNFGSQEQVTNFKVKVQMITVPDGIRPGMSATVDIITEVRDDVLSIPIQSLTVRTYKSEDNIDITNNNAENDFLTDYKNKELEELVFIISDKTGNVIRDKVLTDGNKLEEISSNTHEVYVHIRPVKVGISSNTHYEVLEGLSHGEEIVIGNYKALSKLLEHNMRVKVLNKPE